MGEEPESMVDQPELSAPDPPKTRGGRKKIVAEAPVEMEPPATTTRRSRTKPQKGEKLESVVDQPELPPPKAPKTRAGCKLHHPAYSPAAGSSEGTPSKQP